MTIEQFNERKDVLVKGFMVHMYNTLHKELPEEKAKDIVSDFTALHKAQLDCVISDIVSLTESLVKGEA